MSNSRAFSSEAWRDVGLVVFDVDGTLYGQHALRMIMARDLFLHALEFRSLTVLKVVGSYRRLRERLAHNEQPYFESRIVAEVAVETGRTENQVRMIIAEWIESRPLYYLRRYRFSGLVDIFDGLRRHGKIVGILSDYPAHAKLHALDLVADIVVSPAEEDGGLLKPHPLGLQRLMEQSGVEPTRTLMIGDRVDRDGLAATRAGVRWLLRSSWPRRECQTFRSFEDPLFAPLLVR